jgi:hypothetical protein
MKAHTLHRCHSLSLSLSLSLSRVGGGATEQAVGVRLLTALHYNAYITQLGEHAWREALAVYASMQAAEVPPSAATYRSIAALMYPRGLNA